VSAGYSSAIEVIAVREVRQMNGPGSEVSASMRRHWVMNTSSWPHLVCASAGSGPHLGVVLPDGGDLVAVLADHAVAGDDQPAPGGDLRYPVGVKHVGVGYGAGWPLALVDDGAGVARVGQVVAEAGKKFAEPQDVSVDVEAELGRARGSCRCVLRQLIALGPPHHVDAEAEIFRDFFERCPAVQLAGDGLGGDAADRGLAEAHQRVEPDR
jgi:hypothetical protein